MYVCTDCTGSIPSYTHNAYMQTSWTKHMHTSACICIYGTELTLIRIYACSTSVLKQKQKNHSIIPMSVG